MQQTIFDYIPTLLSDFTIQRLADHQIHRLIEKGVEVDLMKKEWYRRWKLDYPYAKTMSGIEKDR